MSNYIFSSIHLTRSTKTAKPYFSIMGPINLLICLTVAIIAIAQVNGESGQCSFYGAEGEIPPGHPTACGEGFDRWAMKAAHKTLPCGTRIRVRNTDNGRTVDVVINDRGPFTPGRIVDLTYGAFGNVENHDRGVFPCDYQIL